MNKLIPKILCLISLALLISPAKGEETTKFQQYVQENSKPPVHNYSYMPYVTFHMPRYSARYTPRYSFGRNYHMFAMENHYFNEKNEERNHYLEFWEKDTSSPQNEFKIK